MIVNTISEAKTHLSALIDQVQAGEEVVIKKAGQPVAILIRYTEKMSELKPGALRGKIKISEDFDDLLPDFPESTTRQQQ